MIDTLLPVAKALIDALDPLRQAVEDRSGAHFQTLVRELGWDIEAGAWFASLPLVTALEPLLVNALEIRESLNAPERSDLAVIVVQALDMATDVRAALDALAAAPPTGNSVPAVLKNGAFWAELAGDLPEYLLLHWMETHHPVLHAALNLMGVIVPVTVGGTAGRQAITVDELRLSHLINLLQDPLEVLADEVGWTRSGGGSNFTTARAQAFMDKLSLLAASANMRVRADHVRSTLIGSGRYLTQNNALLNTVRELDLSVLRGFVPAAGAAAFAEQGLLLVPIPEQPGGSEVAGLYLGNLSWGTAVTEIDLSETWKLQVSGAADASAAFGVVFMPGLSPTADTNNGGSGDLEFTISSRPGAGPWLPLGAPNKTRIEVDSLEFSVALRTAGNTPDVEVMARSLPDGNTSGITFVIDPGAGDSFVAGLLGSTRIESGADIAASWSAQRGFTVEGSAGFKLEIPIEKNIGPILLRRLLLEMILGSEGAHADVGITAVAYLGPVVLTVDNIGFRVALEPSENGSGSARIGDMALAASFKPPDGVGLAVDGGPVSGGGYLYIDPDANGEYAGILDLDLLSIGISAVGLIDTNLPDGGWSMFMALFIEVPSIPLGFGFTLNGVGGVAGINRALDVEGLQSVIRSGALDGVLFPENPIVDAPFIIEAVQTIFPSSPGRYVFGPVIQIGWGTPTLIEAEIGIVISLPDPIVIAVLGSVTSVLPTPDTDLVALHLEVGGIIDFGAATLSINSSLHGSHIVGFPLSGDMALRSAFGDAPTFLMSLGGSHPGFDRPDNFPEISRLALAINAGSLIDIRFDCYFALTSNSLQFGAAFELTAEVEGFGINGGASFDALITFSPFSLKTDLGYHISVKAVGVDLLAVWLDVSLSGPNPWYVIGTATFTVLGIDNTINLDLKIGSKEPEQLPESEDVLSQVRDALALPDAWSVGAGGGQGVILAAREPLPNEMFVTPDGTLGVSQRVVPLGITIDKSDPWQIEGGYDLFDLEANAPGMESTGPLTDWFAVSSYMDLKPRERLSAPSFERLKSGITFGGGAPTVGVALKGTLDYEQILRDPNLKDATEPLPPYNMNADPRAANLAEMATGQTPQPFSIAADETPIEVHSPGFSITDRLTGEVIGQKQSWMASRAATKGREARVTVVPTWEIDL